GRDSDAEIQVAGGPAAAARLAFAADADARAVADARRNPDVHRVRVPVEPHAEAAHRAVIRVFERQLQFLFDVPSGARSRAAAAARAAVRLARDATAAEERLEEVGEGVAFTEHLAHLV